MREFIKMSYKIRGLFEAGKKTPRNKYLQKMFKWHGTEIDLAFDKIFKLFFSYKHYCIR